MAVIRKIKEKIRKLREARSKRLKTPARKRVEKKAPVKAKTRLVSRRAVAPKDAKRKEVLGAHVVAIEKTKFSHPEVSRPRRMMPQDLPYRYDMDRLVLTVRDPWWLHSYWDVRDATLDKYRHELGDAFSKAKRVLRVYDVTDISFNGGNAHKFFDIQVNEFARSWYIDVGEPGRSWCVDYGLLLPGGRFITILRSNVVQTPLAGPSSQTDEEWLIPEEIWARLYGLAFGMGPTSGGKAWQERIQKALFSGVLSSPGLSSGSPVRKPSRNRKFWLVVDCELIVYGATEPDAAVTVQGRPIKLRSDGTFTMRFALPDGKQVIPVKAVSGDQMEERVITPTVTRDTTSANRFLTPEAEALTIK